jgi:thiol:disulfide interchange protein DsbC
MKPARLRNTLNAALIVVLTFCLSAAAMAEETPEAIIKAKLQQARSDLTIKTVQASVAPGLYEVHLTAGPILYTTPGGDFFVLGDLFAVKMDGIVNLAEQQRDIARKELMASISNDDMIVFAADGERRGSITIFTDVDCFYCQKLHLEVPALNQAGVEVRYLAYPRAGVGSESYRKIASAWCAEDPRDAITRLKSRQEIPDNVCPGNPVADQFMLGQQAGVRGTPALVLESGEMIPGYVSADELVERMGIN